MSKRNPPKSPARAARIAELKRRVGKLADRVIIAQEPDECPLEMQEFFWQQIQDMEQAPWASPFDVLVEGGLELPAPEAMDDGRLSEKLWQLIQGLAMLRIFLYHTDHLSDRELYRSLWHDDLREPLPLMPNDPDSACHLDMLGSGGEEEERLYLTYYADEEERRLWAEDSAGGKLPASAPRPYDRDRLLPMRHGLFDTAQSRPC
ncbi:MAG: hypothetical protein EPN21_18590 [Methylococcaceae bacterium]|nr:MAG: hypothetical protein EPN21_18590 [Methylococcaceae bacterium]